MSPDDPRHGTTAGHNAGCRLECCRAAKLRYDKRRRWEAAQGFGRLVPALGTRRRIRALQAIGHAFPAIAEAANMSPKTIADLCYRSERLSPATVRAVAEAYERLCMTPSPSRYARRSRLAAERKGWAPPLAWDDIDTDPEPRGVAQLATVTPIRERTWDTADHRACPRCGVVRATHADGLRGDLCRDCRQEVA